MAGTDDKGGGPALNSDPASATKDAAAKPKAPRKKAVAATERSSDPDQIAADIERTREELADTLDAIAEKVSPKRVAKRTTKKVADAVKDTAHDAAASVKDTAASAKDKVTGGATGKSGTAWAPDPGPGDLPEPTVVGADIASGPHAATPVYSAPAVNSATYASSGSAIKPEYLAAGAAAALLTWLLVRKRKGGKGKRK